MSETTMRDLHRAMGELLDLLAEVPELLAAGQVGWDLGAGLRGSGGIVIGTLADRERTLLERVAELLGGAGEIRPNGSAFQQADGSRWRFHTLHAEHSGVQVQVTVARPEPSEREELLARLAELDAADAEGGAR